MRAPSFPRKLLVLGLGVLGVCLLVLALRFDELANRLDPWTPPKLETSGVPANPEQALQALEVHGDVPGCYPHEQIERHSDDEEGEDHTHTYVPVKPLPGLKGHAEQIAPYLAHPSEPVVYRAATLLCFIQDRPSKRALAWLAGRYTCRGWVRRVVSGAGTALPDTRCERENPEGGYALLMVRIPSGERNSRPETLVLAQRISKGDATAVREALLATQAMELAQRWEATQALTNVSTPQGLALVFRALLEKWEEKVLSATTSSVNPRMGWNTSQLLQVQGVGGTALRTVAERTGRSQEAVLVETVGLMPEALTMSVYGAVRQNDPLRYAIGRYARSPEGSAVTSDTARRFMDQINRETVDSDPQEIEAESKRITALFQAGDVTALKQIASSSPPNAFHKMLAACYLAGLGDEDLALTVLEQVPPMGLLDLNAIRSEVKQLLERAKPGATRERLQRLHAKLSEHCKLNDCTRESPR